MKHKKLKGLVILSIILCINSIPVISYAKDKDVNTEITQESKIKVEYNWLTKEVGKQCDKDYSELTEQDFLAIKKIDLSFEKIEESIPEEIALLKNLEYLNLNYSKIEGDIPEELAGLSKLKHLDLGDNRINGLPKSVEKKIINGDYTYCDLDGNDIRFDEGMHYLKGKWCYIDRWGQKTTGTQTIDGKKYEFSEEGNLKLGWEQNGDKWYYYDQTGGMIKKAWKDVSGKWYYFNEEGIMQKGLQTIDGVKFYLNDSGVMLTGWQEIDNKKYYFTNTGGMQYGWLNLGNNTYYFDESTGEMAVGEKNIGGKNYTFDSQGIVGKNRWIDNYTYVQPNGETAETSNNYSHSNTNYDLFKYMTDPSNQESVDRTAVALHGGVTSNNCVYFLSESLRRVGVGIPRSMCNTYQLENELKGRNYVYSYDLSQLKPGDIVFTNGYTHVYTFMGWDKDGYAYIVDNQKYNFGGQILHRRNIIGDTATTDRATHFFYAQN